MSLHNSLTGTDVHVSHAYTYADASARTGASGLTAADVGKIAKQTDTSKFYILTNHSPVTWSEVTAVAGTGGINYISNFGSEDAATGWTTYADAAATSPVDGTGGSPNVTITRSTSSPLRGTANFLLTKDAANRQGQGVSYDFTIDRADIAKMLEISFDYETTTGFAASSGAVGSDSDVEVYLYDVTNAVQIPVTPKVLTSGVGIETTFLGAFQTASNSSSYRLILHVATTSATAWTLKFDNVRVGPPVLSQSTPVIDLVVTGTPANVTGGNPVIFPTKQKDSVNGYNVSTGQYTAQYSGDYLVSASVDTNTSGNNIRIYKNGSLFSVIGQTNTAGFGAGTGVVPCTAGDIITVTLSATTTAMGNSQLSIFMLASASSGSDTRVVAARYSGTPGTSVTANTQVNFTNKTYDTHAAVTTGASWKFTAPVSGKYQVLVHSDKLNAFSGYIYKNGVSSIRLIDGLTTNNIQQGSATIDLVAGDFIDFRPDTTYTPGSSNDLFIEVSRLSGPAAIAATEAVIESRETTAGQSFNNGVTAIIDFGTTIKSTHGGYTAGVGYNGAAGTYSTAPKWTAPTSGVYEIYACAAWSATTAEWASDIDLLKNGSIVHTLAYGVDTTATRRLSMPISYTLSLLAGDYIQVQVTNSSGGTLTLNNNATKHPVFAVRKVG